MSVLGPMIGVFRAPKRAPRWHGERENGANPSSFFDCATEPARMAAGTTEPARMAAGNARSPPIGLRLGARPSYLAEPRLSWSGGGHGATSVDQQCRWQPSAAAKTVWPPAVASMTVSPGLVMAWMISAVMPIGFL
jgi:hypothetical protein